MANSIMLGRVIQMPLTNKSGGAVAQGDVVIVDLTTAAAFTTTTTSGYLNGAVGVVLEPNGIANNAIGMVAFAGPVPVINLSGAASLGDLFKTHTVAKQAVRHAASIQAGDFGIVLGTGTTPAALLWGLPAGATGAGTGDFSGPGSSVANNLVGFNGTGGKTGQDSGMGLNGWIAAGETWVYVSADDPTYVYKVAGVDLTGKYQAGMRVKYTQTTGGVKYGIITKVAFSTDTTITLYQGTDYDMANEAITLPFYSPFKAPFGFPMDPAKWTVEVLDTTDLVQSSPVSGTWYNVLTINIPIGCWAVSWQGLADTDRAAAGTVSQYTALSTANNSSSDLALLAVAFAANETRIIQGVGRDKFLTLTAKTPYYLNFKTTTGSIISINLRGDVATTAIRAVCAYL